MSLTKWEIEEAVLALQKAYRLNYISGWQFKQRMYALGFSPHMAAEVMNDIDAGRETQH